MKRWVALLASTVIALVLAELAARAIVPDVYLQRSILAGGVIVPYEPGGVADLLTDEFRVRYEINSFGHRDRGDRQEMRIDGRPRIALLGDSFSAGWGVEFEDSFGAIFEEATGIEVINAAKNGGCPLWFIPQARYIRERFHPDLLLVQLFDNDPDDNTQTMKHFSLEVGDRFDELPFELEPPRTPGRWIAYQFNRLTLRNRFRRLVRKIKGKEVHRSLYVVPGGLPSFKVLSREESIAARKIDFASSRPWEGAFAFHDPNQHEAWRDRITWNAQLLDQLLDEAAAEQIPVAFVYVPAYPVFLREPETNIFADSSKAIAEAHGALWLDARETFASHDAPWSLYHPHDAHLNALGHAVLAEALVDALASRVHFADQAPGETDSVR